MTGYVEELRVQLQAILDREELNESGRSIIRLCQFWLGSVNESAAELLESLLKPGLHWATLSDESVETIREAVINLRGENNE